MNKSAYIQNLQLYPTDPAVGSKREISTPHTSSGTNIQGKRNKKIIFGEVVGLGEAGLVKDILYNDVVVCSHNSLKLEIRC